MASMKSFAAFDRIPMEIWEQIAHALPINSLPSFVLSCRKFYQCANPFLYRTVYFFHSLYGRKPQDLALAFADEELCFGVHRAQSWLSHSNRSALIIHPRPFLQAITTNPKLRSHIAGASFEWRNSTEPEDVLILKQCVEYLKSSLRLMRLALPDFDTTFAITSNVTFLEIQYPDEFLLTNDRVGSRYDASLHKGLRDNVYSIFCIPTLRHLSIRNAKTWDVFYPIHPPDDSRTSTSNIISLSLPDTVPLSRDLAEILTWPIALRHLYHKNPLESPRFFNNFTTEPPTSPKVFIEALYSQRHAIEELIYNNADEYSNNRDTPFGTALRDFGHLKCLALSRDSLLGYEEDKGPHDLHETLPPNLEELWLLVDDRDNDKEYEPALKQGLQGIAMNKEQYCPYLRKLVLWAWNRVEYADFEALYDLKSTFGEVGIQFEITFDNHEEFGDLGETGWRTSEA